MIKWVKYDNLLNTPSGYGADVKSLLALKNKKINFTDGINFIVASNGTGKTTLIDDIAKLHYVYEMGIYKIWYASVQEVTHGGIFTHDYEFKNGLKISSDGNVCYISDRLYGNLPNPFDSDPNYNDKLIERFNQTITSSGQSSFRSFYTMWEVIRHMDFNKKRLETIKKYQNTMGIDDNDKDLKKYLKHLLNPSIKTPGKPTILIDELDSNLDIISCIYLLKALKQISNRFQIIMSTHSPFIYYMKNVNIIELEDGYKDKCVKLINEFMNECKEDKTND